MSENEQTQQKPEKKRSLFTVTNVLLALLVIYAIANTAWRLTGNG